MIPSHRLGVTDATYTINHDGGATSKTVDQGSSGGQWVSLGSYAFTAGIDKSITLSNQPSSEASSAAEQRAQAKLTSVRGAEARRRRVSCSLQVSNKPWRPELEELKSDGVA